jgi:hypothetical protein
MGETRNAYRIFVGKFIWKQPLERPRQRWEDVMEIDFREVGLVDGRWMKVA